MKFRSYSTILKDVEHGSQDGDGPFLRPAWEQHVGGCNRIRFHAIVGSCNNSGEENWGCAASNYRFELDPGYGDYPSRVAVSQARDTCGVGTSVAPRSLFTRKPSIKEISSESRPWTSTPENHFLSLTSRRFTPKRHASSSSSSSPSGISTSDPSPGHSLSGHTHAFSSLLGSKTSGSQTAHTVTNACHLPSRKGALQRYLTTSRIKFLIAWMLLPDLRYSDPDKEKGKLRTRPVSLSDSEGRTTDGTKGSTLESASKMDFEKSSQTTPPRTHTKRRSRCGTALRRYSERWRWDGDAWGWYWGSPWRWPGDRWRTRLATDIPAGLLVALVQLPHALAVARLCCVDAATGCRTAAVSSLVYALLGPSPALAPGPSALVCLLTRDTLFTNLFVRIDHPLDSARVAAVSAVGAVTRLVFVVTRLGPFAAAAVSDAVFDAAMVASALHAIAAALPHAAGTLVPAIHAGIFSIWDNAMEISKNKLTERSTSAPGLANATFLLTLFSATLLTPLFLRWRPSYRHVRHLRLFLPAEIMVLLAARAVAELLPQATGEDRLIVNMEAGLRPSLPALEGLSLYTIVLSLVTTLAAQTQALQEARANHHSPVRIYKELVALCVCDGLGCFLGCVPVTASPHASAAFAAIGARSQLANAVGGVLLLVALWTLVPSPVLADTLPAAALAGLLVFNVCGFFTYLADLKVIWKISKRNLAYWIVTFFTSLVAGMALGLLTGIMVQLIIDFFCFPKPPVMLLGKIDVPIGGQKKVIFTKLDKNIAEEVAGIKVIRIYSPFDFKTRTPLKKEIFSLLKVNPEKIGADAEAMRFGKTPEDKITAMIEENLLTSFQCYENSSNNELLKTWGLRKVILDCTEPGIFDFSGVITLKGLQENFEKIGVKTIIVSRIARISTFSEFGDAVNQVLKDKEAPMT